MSNLIGSVKITVRGPGGLINYEMDLIEQALKAAGITVHVDNDCKDAHKDTETYTKFRNEKTAKEGYEVTLIADHIPWGG